jgi:uncharacterized protein YeaO (DUF488 family)
MPFRVKRIYEPKSADDGVRVLVDRLWPRGISKDAGLIDRWAKEVSPSTALRREFQHDAARWEDFVVAYRLELAASTDARSALDELRRLSRTGRVTLLYAARDTSLNNAVALMRILQAAP